MLCIFWRPLKHATVDSVNKTEKKLLDLVFVNLFRIIIILYIFEQNLLKFNHEGTTISKEIKPKQFLCLPHCWLGPFK